MTTTHPTQTAGESQCDLILRELKAIPGQWVSMPALVDCSGSYNVHSRISELRRRGHTIEHKNDRTNGATHSFYRIMPNNRTDAQRKEP